MKYISIIITVILLTACEKNNLPSSPMASLTVANVVVNGNNVKLNNYLRDSALVNNVKQFSLNAGNNNIYLFPSTDSLHPYYNNSITTGNGDLYTLFLTGDATTTIDAVLKKESNIPWYTDSACAVRFANMSPDNVPVKLVLSATPGTTEFASTDYKTITDFKEYSAKSTEGSYVFEIRDASSDAVLGTYSLVTPRFHAVTLVWKGVAAGNGANAQDVLRVNHY